VVQRHDTAQRSGARTVLIRRAARPAKTVLAHRTVRIPLPPGRVHLTAALALLALAHGGLFVAALAGAVWPFIALAVAVCALEPALSRVAPVVLWGTREVQLGQPWRWAVQGAALLCLVSAGSGPRLALDAAVAVAVLTLGGCFGALETAGQAVELLRKSPLLGRNLDLTGLSVPPPPSWLLRRRSVVLAPLQLAVLVVGALTASRLWPTPTGVAVLALVVLAALVIVGAAARALLATRRSSPRKAAETRVRRSLVELAPEVLLCYGGGPDALYQVQMWLRVLERAPQRTLVVLRDPECLRRLAPTTLPVVCAVSGTLLMTLEIPSARAALFVANAANNAHLIRRRGVATAFIGHGDSDKLASSSPFLKAYDELWVAGPAAAARLQAMQIPGVLGRLREVGRPQAVFLTPQHLGSSEQEQIRTVLYAPTWEGWGDEEHSSSLQHGGVELVRRLLAAPGVRLVYRPHPLTGSRDSVARRANEQILDLMDAAGAPAPTTTPAGRAAGDAEDLSGLDDLALMLGRCDPQRRWPAPRRARQVDADDADDADEQFWQEAPASVPRVSHADRPGLVSCFRHSDLLIADVSSVVTDWVALDRPFALMLPPRLTTEQFIGAYPTAAAATLIGTDGAGLDGLLADLSTGRDPCAPRRRAIRVDLLGSPPEAGQQRFEAALRWLIASSAPGHAATPDRREQPV